MCATHNSVDAETKHRSSVTESLHFAASTWNIEYYSFLNVILMKTIADQYSPQYGFFSKSCSFKEIYSLKDNHVRAAS